MSVEAFPVDTRPGSNNAAPNRARMTPQNHSRDGHTTRARTVISAAAGATIVRMTDLARIAPALSTWLTRLCGRRSRPSTVRVVREAALWNEFLWPFRITKQADMHPLAVSLANYNSTLQATVANPFGSVIAGACALAAPVVGLFIVFQRHFTSSDIGSGVEG